MEQKMTSGTPWKQILVFSIPVFVGLLLQQLYNTVDTIVVGNFASEEALSAVGTTGSLGDSKSGMYFLLIASAVNIGLDLLFVAVFKMSAAGAAIATDISQALSCIAAFVYMYRRYPAFRFSRKEFHLDRAIVGQIAKMGFPVTLQQMIAGLGIVFIQRAVNGYGQAMTASFTVGSRIEMYAQMPLNAFYMALATFVGQNMGAGQIDRVKKGAKQTILLSMIVTAVIAAGILLFADQLIGLFGISGQAMDYCREHIRVTVLAFVLQCVYLPLFGVFQGAGDGFAITRTAAVALGIRVLTTYTLCYLPIFGYRIVWWNMVFGFTGGFIITWIHYLRGTWQYKGIVRTKERTSIREIAKMEAL